MAADKPQLRPPEANVEERLIRIVGASCGCATKILVFCERSRERISFKIRRLEIKVAALLNTLYGALPQSGELPVEIASGAQCAVAVSAHGGLRVRAGWEGKPWEETKNLHRT